jgi:hypothetical protein
MYVANHTSTTTLSLSFLVPYFQSLQGAIIENVLSNISPHDDGVGLGVDMQVLVGLELQVI